MKSSKENYGNDDALMETLLSSYQRHYPREDERLLSLYRRKVVENEVMTENEESDLITEPPPTDTSTRSAGSVL